MIDEVLSGTVLPGSAAVAVQGYNTLLRAVRLELDVKEQQGLVERLEALEATLDHKKERGRFGA